MNLVPYCPNVLFFHSKLKSVQKMVDGSKHVSAGKITFPTLILKIKKPKSWYVQVGRLHRNTEKSDLDNPSSLCRMLSSRESFFHRNLVSLPTLPPLQSHVICVRGYFPVVFNRPNQNEKTHVCHESGSSSLRFH